MDSRFAGGDKTGWLTTMDQPRTDFRQFSGPDSGSLLSRYSELTVGDRSILRLVSYEIRVGMLRFVPGAAGLLLRRAAYRGLFKSAGAGCSFGCGVSLLQPARISLGKRCFLDDFSALGVRGGPDSWIELGDRVMVSRGAVVNVRQGAVTIGSDTTLGGTSRIACSQGNVSIGQHVMVAAFSYVGGVNHRSGRTDVPMIVQGVDSKGGVVIEDDVWIGAHCVVLDGARIGRGSIIGACSLVNGEIPPYSVAYGTPARVQRQREMQN
jgi:acetyltransferase-like isoleucine patch superfamily enzyme